MKMQATSRLTCLCICLRPFISLLDVSRQILISIRILEIKVNICGLASSNADLMLDSTFSDEAALKGYAVHPAHVAVADGKVRPYTANRVCLDYEI